MQLRKLTTAMLVMGLSAGLAHAEDGAPAAGSTLDKIAKNGVIVVWPSRIFCALFLLRQPAESGRLFPGLLQRHC
ncbi:ABC transporter periplasmic binding protein [Salmonella enterica subsp. arizonae]|uniref:ABC transporter periplasmic binding protein n=1 Tax=Salmonella enterica subsp. arizonae TaxID=59203 RepID=A0A379S5Q7_SALER|nr:ABC transporter periplasmic binding protein [Salmonella enterica subsp. arizonae]